MPRPYRLLKLAETDFDSTAEVGQFAAGRGLSPRMGGLFWLPHTWDGRACAATSIAIEDPEHVRIASQIHQRARHFDLDPGRPSDSRLFRHYHRQKSSGANPARAASSTATRSSLRQA